jgi:toxin-antitoxin system PIN domain toxin
MRSLFDVNFLIALLQPDHVHHQRAQGWWEANESDGWASCPLTENGFARVVSQTGQRPLTAAGALRFLSDQAASTNHAFWPDDISLTDSDLFRFDRILGPKQLTDIYLLGLAVRNDGRLATFDRGISAIAVKGAEQRHLIAI